MFEKVNPSHPDKVADRIAGAIVDLCYTKSENPKVACEVLLGHGECNIQVETSEQISAEEIEAIVSRIAGEGIDTRALIVPQDSHLAANQRDKFRCGDNGIFKGVPVNEEQHTLTSLAASLYRRFPYDGKYVCGSMMLNPNPKLRAKVYGVTICQSHATEEQIDNCVTEWEQENYAEMDEYPYEACCINPLGEWTGGPDTDSGATNRKLGSDMGDGVTGGGLHGKDISKADVSVNIVCHILAQRTGKPVTAMCSIGDEQVTFRIGDEVREFGYDSIVNKAQCYIKRCGGFEKFSEWGLIRPVEM